MKQLRNFIPFFLTKLISSYTFQKKFLYGSFIISFPVIVATIIAYFYIGNNGIIGLFITFFLLGLIIVLFLFFGAVYISVMETIHELQVTTEKWKQGELSVRLKLTTNDELKEIGLAFNEITSAFEQEIEEHKAIRYVIEQALKKNNQLITAINSLEIGVIITEVSKYGHKTIYVNPGFEKITGYSEKDIFNKGLSILQGEKTSPEAREKIANAIKNKEQVSIEIVNYHKNGNPFWNYLHITPVYNQEGEFVNFIGTITDITKQKKSDEKIYELAYFDQLTEIANVNYMKELFYEKLNSGVNNFALLYIDIDRFKNLNSKLGFNVGNLVLKEFASRLKVATDKCEGLLARASKDEYIYLLFNVEDQGELRAIADEINSKVSYPFFVNHYEFYLGASIGISLYPKDSDNFDQLLQNAETAMYEAKVNSYNKAYFYRRSMSQFYKETHELENYLKFAIDRQQLKLVYQPKISLPTGRLVGAEALVRWEHPQGMISPAKFIPIAEKTGLIFQLGSWVLEQACQKRKEWTEAGISDFHISVNISAKQFKQEYFVPLIENMLVKTEIAPHLLEIELTESALHNEENAKKLLFFLKSKHIAVSIDDFGTGYSSLNYLRILPINTLKVDRSFIMEIETNERSSKLLESIVAMGHSLNLNVIAEGVETKKQLMLLKEMGCNEVQGYFVSKPLEEQDFVSFVENYSPTNFLQQFPIYK